MYLNPSQYFVTGPAVDIFLQFSTIFSVTGKYSSSDIVSGLTNRKHICKFEVFIHNGTSSLVHIYPLFLQFCIIFFFLQPFYSSLIRISNIFSHIYLIKILFIFQLFSSRSYWFTSTDATLSIFSWSQLKALLCLITSRGYLFILYS